MWFYGQKSISCILLEIVDDYNEKNVKRRA
jgi:hypothetical protein